jgi:hypothetical protein
MHDADCVSLKIASVLNDPVPAIDQRARATRGPFAWLAHVCTTHPTVLKTPSFKAIAR